MRWSMKYSTEYNEVLINSTKYTENLPASVAAIVYGLRGEDSAIFDKVKPKTITLPIQNKFQRPRRGSALA